MNSVNPFARLPVCPLKIKDYILCFISAALLILSFPKFNIWLFTWFGFVPLFFALQNKSKAKAFFLSYITGIIFWAGTIYWLIHVTLLGLILLVLYLALYFGFFGLIISRPAPCALCPAPLLFIPSLWVLLEYLRSHLFTGFPWALLGYSQYLNLPIIQIADIAGAWGVSFLVVMVNVIIKEIIGSRFKVQGSRQKINYKFLFVACGLWLVACGYGVYKLYLRPVYPERSRGAPCALRLVKISVIQGNIPQELKWNPGAKDFIMNKYFTLTRQAVEGKPDLIIWPEAALPVVLEEEPIFFERVEDLVRGVRTPLLLGAVTTKEGIYYNSALLVSGEGKLLNKYNKLHLVPFGEYIPLRKTFRFLETIVPIGDFTAGKDYTIFELSRYPVTPLPRLNAQTRKRANAQTNFSALICFEDLFPQISREFVKKGANFLVNITNDAWFSKTSSPYQHLQASVFRAVENRVNLVRAANTGISGFIAPSGEIISLVRDEKGRNIFIDGYQTQEIIISKRPLSFYTRYGDVFVAACILFILYGIISRLH